MCVPNMPMAPVYVELVYEITVKTDDGVQKMTIVHKNMSANMSVALVEPQVEKAFPGGVITSQELVKVVTRENLKTKLKNARRSKRPRNKHQLW